MSKLVHIHAHSEHSALDGMGKIREMFELAKSYGQNALAISDHGTTSGLWEAQCVADELDMKAIMASEFYYERENDGKNGHLLILAKNDEGLANIFKMQELAHQNFYMKPRINWDILKEHSEGLIVTSACLASPFNQMIMDGDVQGATEWARKFKNVFSEDFYIEIQPNSIPEQQVCNTTGIRIAERLGIEIVATNDVHYSLQGDCIPHEVLLAMQVKKKMSDPDRFKFDTEDFWLKSEKEMYDTFKGVDKKHVEQAIINTSVIAEKCNARINKGKYLPHFYDVQDGETETERLKRNTYEHARKKGLNKDFDFMDAVDEELAVIDEGGYSGYFLIVDDYIRSERERGGLVGDGRGSGAGSKVAYLNDITTLDPVPYGLLFERFMARGRTPDIDTDFSDQDAVFDALTEKYGEDSVARVIAYAKMKPRSVVRKVLSTFEHEAHEISRITKLIDEMCPTMEQAYANSQELVKIKEQFPQEFKIIERLEGVMSHTTMHAGGVVIYPHLSSILPVRGQGRDRRKLIVEFDKDMLEDIGHYKFDILGLSTLPVIQYCLESIKQTEGIDLDLESIDYEDPLVYEMLSQGDVSGVFQLSAQSAKVMEQKPKNFRDLIAINSLVRPGVGDWAEYIERRQGKEWPIMPERKWYMDETYGTMTYQEQFLLDAHVLAGWEVAYADKKLRKNRDIRNDEETRIKFLADCESNGHARESIEKVWQEIEDAVDGGYSFNKSHSAVYAKISFKTAYLKYYYPEHFYASLMTGAETSGEGQDKVAGYIAECKQRGIQINPPNINMGSNLFVVSRDGINYRLNAISHVGENAIAHIQSLRPIHSLEDFLSRITRKLVNKRTVINLIKAGVFDFDNPNRGELLWQYDMFLRTKTQVKIEHQCEPYEYNDRIKADWEMETMGLYLSVHPLEKYGFKSLDTYKDGGDAMQGGEVYDKRVFKDKNSNEMAFIFINTLFGNVKALVFSRDWESKKLQKACEIGNIVIVKGRRTGNDIIGEKVEIL